MATPLLKPAAPTAPVWPVKTQAVAYDAAKLNATEANAIPATFENHKLNLDWLHEQTTAQDGRLVVLEQTSFQLLPVYITGEPTTGFTSLLEAQTQYGWFGNAILQFEFLYLQDEIIAGNSTSWIGNGAYIQLGAGGAFSASQTWYNLTLENYDYGPEKLTLRSVTLYGAKLFGAATISGRLIISGNSECLFTELALSGTGGTITVEIGSTFTCAAPLPPGLVVEDKNEQLGANPGTPAALPFAEVSMELGGAVPLAQFAFQEISLPVAIAASSAGMLSNGRLVIPSAGRWDIGGFAQVQAAAQTYSQLSCERQRNGGAWESIGTAAITAANSGYGANGFSKPVSLLAGDMLRLVVYTEGSGAVLVREYPSTRPVLFAQKLA